MLEILMQEIKNVRTSFYRESIYISASTVMNATAGFIFWNIATNLYSLPEVGIASTLVSAMNLIVMVSFLGLNFSLIRFYPRYREKTIGTTIIVTLIASVIFSTMYLLIVGNSESFRGVFSTKLLAIFVFFSMIGTTYNVLFTYGIAKKRAKHSFILSIFFSLRFLFLVFLISFGALGIVTAFGLGLTLGVIYGLIALDDIKLGLDFEYLKISFKFSLTNYIAHLANITPKYIMPTIVLAMLGKEDAAYLYIAFAVGDLILFVPNAINTSLFVEGSHGVEYFRKTLRKAMIFAYLYLVLATVFIWLFGGYVLRFFGEKYINSLPLLKLIILGGFSAVLVDFFTTILNIKSKLNKVLIINLSRAVLFLLLSYLLIQKFGILGVGIGWNIGNAIVALKIILFERHRYFFK
ncbi:lipopolysaccharide biosynthesis protein [Pyrococcus abyssi]|nr:lipopolysaccharide biosynthesis protein [Pyrococcus abyssi]